MAEQLMDLDELCARLKCKKSWARSQLEARKWPFRMVAHSYRFAESDYAEILELLAERPAAETRPAASRPPEIPRPTTRAKRPLRPRKQPSR